MKKKLKICLICSSGGHLTKMWYLKEWWSDHPHFWVTRKDEVAEQLLKKDTVYFGYFPENRNFINFVKNLFLAVKILSKENPQLIFSTGAGIAPPFFMVAKFFRIKTIFMETFISIPKPTLSGRIIYYFGLADIFLVQNQALLKVYPKAFYKGSVL